ncbi:hypothetical protein [Microbulbifer variabilis]|uniref:hypothetical protein n=1 Tax=Microbulbifer variabilis TaxID=266805 RepID=UPI001CFEAEBF|nr:hypothetical protein [Microbulbifer variabilis]
MINYSWAVSSPARGQALGGGNTCLVVGLQGIRYYSLGTNLQVYGASFLGEPPSNKVKATRLLQRLLWRLRALDLQRQLAELLSDIEGA